MAQQNGKEEGKGEAVMVKRWHFWGCFEAPEGLVKAQREIERLKKMGYPAKVWSPLPRHKTSGHIHIVILITKKELYELLKERKVKQD